LPLSIRSLISINIAAVEYGGPVSYNRFMDNKDYYKILDVKESADSDEIKKAYRNLAFRYHPDRNPGGQEQMKEVNEAYAVLSNQEKRREYDQLRQSFGSFARDRFRQTHTEEDIFRNSDINQIFEELSKIFGFSRPEDIFTRDAFYGRNYQEFKFKGPGVSGGGLFFFGPLGTASRTAAGPAGKESLASRLMVKGLTKLQKMAAKKLGIVLPEKGRDFNASLTVTPDQAIAGGKVKYTIYQGNAPREVLITVPAGIREGQKIKLKGLGEEGKDGGDAGDLFLKVRIRRPFFERMKEILKS
jgi:curved DNA-binding protein CbpA